MAPAIKAGELGEGVVSEVEILLQGYSNYLQALQKSPRTIYEYCKALRAWGRWWRKPVDQFDTEAWDQFTFHETESGCTGVTIRVRQSALRGFYRYLRRKKIVKHDPSQDAEAVGVRKRLPEFLTEAQVQAMYGACSSPADTALLEILYGAGLRNSEARALEPHNITPEFIRVVGGKGNKERIVTIKPGMWTALKTHLEGREGYFYALGWHKGKKIAMMSVQRIVRRLARSAGISQRVTPHTLRHSIATHLLARGCGLAYIQNFLGHTSIETTRIYTHIADGQQTQAILTHHPRS